LSLVRQASNMNLLEGIRVGRNELNMLQFVHNILFLCNLGINDLVVIKSNMRCYELSLGIMINFH